MEADSLLYSHDPVIPLHSPVASPRMIALSYWERYYNEAPEIRQRTMPSDFCITCVNTVFRHHRGRIADLGCGNGRDAIFLAHNGFEVTAIDQSGAALMLLTEHARRTLVSVETHQGDFTRFHTPMPSHAYSRFSLHAIDDNAQRTLFTNMRKMVFDDHIFAIEARTTEDINPNATEHEVSWDADHYRRYLHVPTLLEELTDAGFGIKSIISGRDLAPLHGVENPHVVRIIAT